MLSSIIRFFLKNRLTAILAILAILLAGYATAPFNWNQLSIPRTPVPVDAIPDLGENQQIVFTEWKGRSPEDIDNQITYPLTTSLMGIPGVKTIRSSSVFGFSSIYVVFEDGVDFYWSRSRILEKLNALPAGTLPSDVNPMLGPDATALGQVYWYTLEGRDKSGNVVGGWGLDELRTIQDFTIKYSLSSVSGVSEVASIGGFVKEYQIDLDPEAMRSFGITLAMVHKAVSNSNIDVGAKTLELNRVEYLVRGIGYIEKVQDLEQAVILEQNNVPIRIKDIGRVTIGPANRRGVLDKGGSETVGGVVVARYGANPMQVIESVKEEIDKLSEVLPEKELENGVVSKVTIVPFYDRSTLITETLGTLESALTLEILLTILVIVLMVLNIRASFLISSMLPIGVLMCFILMRLFKVDANIVALSGIAIAIGTMVDLGIVMSENILQHLENRKLGQKNIEVVFNAAKEVASAIFTSVSTTVVSFVPVFAMEGAEGKLFGPLAATKTFALVSAAILVLTVLPVLAYWIFSFSLPKGWIKNLLNIAGILIGSVVLVFSLWLGVILLVIGFVGFSSMLKKVLPERWHKFIPVLDAFIYSLVFVFLLSSIWLPLGPERSLFVNFLFVGLLSYSLIGLFYLLIKFYPKMLSWCLANKGKFLLIPAFFILWGGLAWGGAKKVFFFFPDSIWETKAGELVAESFPKASEEFMPSLDEGAFLLMPTTMPHAGMEENIENLQLLDRAVQNIPEVNIVVGKAGRVESPLDPAPMSMFENIITYKPEYVSNKKGEPIRFKVSSSGNFVLDENGELIPDSKGRYYRNWRDHIHSPDDIWEEIAAIKLPGVTSAPKLQPIETRLVMLQTGMRAPIGIKILGSDLHAIQEFGESLEPLLRDVEGVKESSVFADRIVGKPYIQVVWDREKLARFGLKIGDAQEVLQMAMGGKTLTTTVEGRERYPVRIRYARGFRDSPNDLSRILLSTNSGNEIPLKEVARLDYVQGPQAVKSENTFLVGYVLFDKEDKYSEVDVVENARAAIKSAISKKELIKPEGVKYEFAGNYENQVRAKKRLGIVIPGALLVIFLILYFQFESVPTTLMIFSSIIVAFCGGFIMIWLYGQDWFLNFSVFSTNLRGLFQMKQVNLSVAVWVGFIALFGIATDDGVVMTTYIQQTFKKSNPSTKDGVRNAILEAGQRRIKPCLMTTATTLLALLPVLTSSGRGADVMIPMAIPSFGGMAIELITLFVIPVLFSMWEELKISRKGGLK